MSESGEEFEEEEFAEEEGEALLLPEPDPVGALMAGLGLDARTSHSSTSTKSAPSRC